MNVQKIGFVGLGLIGGSIAKTLKRVHPEIELIATAGHRATILEACEDHTISNDNLLELSAFADCDYIFLCTPVQVNISYLKEFKDILNPDCILTDVGSVKGDIHKAVDELGMGSRFIGGHPMAGSEKTGYRSATSYLLENAYYILTPGTGIPEKKVQDFYNLIKELGAIPMVLPYDTHDYATASISHLPHVIASALVNLIRDSDDEAETMKTIAAGGFKDITRIASSSPVMWENICISNRDKILTLIDKFILVLSDIRGKIKEEDGPAISRFFENAKNYRDSLTIRTSKLSVIYELYCDLIDEEGGIATIAAILAGNHINIKNIGIIHNREFEQGVLHVEFYELDALERAKTLLTASGYTIYLR